MRKILVIISIFLIVVSAVVTAYVLFNYDKDLVDLNSIKTDSKYENVTYDKAENVFDEGVVGILEIEKIGLKATVKEGTTNNILKEYIGHIENTASYDGNIGLAAHNRGNKYSYFARINELEEGDILIYTTKFYTRKYVVDKIAVVFEDDWGLLRPSEENKLTLITCIANKKNQRLCLQATQLT
ncbi:MAG: class D sortase [Lachnospiraceae bacterium]|jgi:sortase A|nr:class D sortase [Lachnospiraceae bacterium]